MRTLRALHTKRRVEFSEGTHRVKILRPGAKFVQELVRKKNLSDVR
jgi:hypothetical protein